MKRFVMLALVGALLGACSTTTYPPQQIRLNLQPGQQWTTVMIQVSTFSTEQSSAELKATSTITTATKVLTPTNADWPLEVRLESASAISDFAGRIQRTSTDPDAAMPLERLQLLVDRPLTITLAANFALDDTIGGFEAVSDDLRSYKLATQQSSLRAEAQIIEKLHSYKNILTQYMFDFGTWPDQAVQVGDSWVQQGMLSAEEFNGVEIPYDVKFTLQDRRATELIIELEFSGNAAYFMTAEEQLALNGVAESVLVQQAFEVTGELVVNAETGWPIKTTFDKVQTTKLWHSNDPDQLTPPDTTPYLATKQTTQTTIQIIP